MLIVKRSNLKGVRFEDEHIFLHAVEVELIICIPIFIKHCMLHRCYLVLVRTVEGMDMVGKTGRANDWISANISECQEIHFHAGA